MAIDTREIELTEDQKRRIAEIAELTGKPWREVLEEQLPTPAEAAQLKLNWPYKDRYIEDREKWQVGFCDWLSKQTSHNPNFDDSRENIYP